MILIADSGSTKTDWRLIAKNGKIFSFKSEGINPYFHSSSSITRTLERLNIQPFNFTDISEIYFYGAGSSNAQNLEIMQLGFQPIFTNAKIHILHDLLGAARALYKDDSGIVAILGTGSNSCLFLDGKVELALGGQGYILGDEGSGMHIGRKVVREFMNDLMPSDILQVFKETYGLTKDEISFSVYKKDFPNRFLASFCTFVFDNIDHPYILGLADDAFMKFFDRYIIQYPEYQKYPLRIVGSVGYFYREQIQKQADRCGIKLDAVIRAPIDGLVKYHLK